MGCFRKDGFSGVWRIGQYGRIAPVKTLEKEKKKEEKTTDEYTWNPEKKKRIKKKNSQSTERV